jgi:hypothetical protein
MKEQVSVHRSETPVAPASILTAPQQIILGERIKRPAGADLNILTVGKQGCHHYHEKVTAIPQMTPHANSYLSGAREAGLASARVPPGAPVASHAPGALPHVFF